VKFRQAVIRKYFGFSRMLRNDRDFFKRDECINLSNEIRTMLNRTPEELSRDIRLYAGLMLFRLGKLSSGAAAEMAGIPRVMFFDLCADYGIPVSQIDPDELCHEVEDE
jgi:hypothetical protein